jgi:hypothetical protein
MKIESEIWDMKEGNILSIKYNEQVYVLNNSIVVHNIFPVKKHKRYSNIIDSWIKKNHISEFDFNQFQQANPNIKCNRFNHFISLMIQDRTIIQLGNDKFKVGGKGK